MFVVYLETVLVFYGLVFGAGWEAPFSEQIIYCN